VGFLVNFQSASTCDKIHVLCSQSEGHSVIHCNFAVFSVCGFFQYCCLHCHQPQVYCLLCVTSYSFCTPSGVIHQLSLIYICVYIYVLTTFTAEIALHNTAIVYFPPPVVCVYAKTGWD